MRSTPEKFRLPTALKEPVDERVKELPYESFSAYLVGLVRFDLMTRKPHSATGAISKLSRSEQDKIDDEIATVFKSGKSLGGSWFEARLQAAVQASGLPEPERHRIVNELLQRLASRSGE